MYMYHTCTCTYIVLLVPQYRHFHVMALHVVINDNNIMTNTCTCIHCIVTCTCIHCIVTYNVYSRKYACKLPLSMN